MSGIIADAALSKCGVMAGLVPAIHEGAHRKRRKRARRTRGDGTKPRRSRAQDHARRSGRRAMTGGSLAIAAPGIHAVDQGPSSQQFALAARLVAPRRDRARLRSCPLPAGREDDARAREPAAYPSVGKVADHRGWFAAPRRNRRHRRLSCQSIWQGPGAGAGWRSALALSLLAALRRRLADASPACSSSSSTGLACSAGRRADSSTAR